MVSLSSSAELYVPRTCREAIFCRSKTQWAIDIILKMALGFHEVFDEEKEHWFAHQITSKLHAKKLFVIDPALIRNAKTNPLPPITALAVFFADQKPSFFESDYHTDPTVRNLCQLAFDICEQGRLETGMMRRSHVQKHLIRKVEELNQAQDGSLKDYIGFLHKELSTISRSPSPSLSTESRTSMPVHLELRLDHFEMWSP
ncbi:hypothetical protein [Absidia glauca]|uniref:Uncharacterized protein n=1 Tax=Absidia glauca TaxID=4829 RepID=A0A163JK85_ABSGL|nr:hypothetical protein [Absidia glauca]